MLNIKQYFCTITIAILFLLFFGCQKKNADTLLMPVILSTSATDFQYTVENSAVKRLEIMVESNQGYANLSLVNENKVLLDNLDIPGKGNYTFDVLIDFASMGSKKLKWQKKGGDLIIRKLTFSEVMDMDIPVFKDISGAVGLTTEPSWKYGGPTVADVDNNGYYDLILNNHDKISTQLFLQKEKGKFTEKEIFSFLADFHGTAAGDYDNDGDLDIANSRGGGNGTAPSPPYLLQNDGETFNLIADKVGITTGARGRSLRWIDADLDGDLDLFSVNAAGINSTDSIQHLFYENLGNGQFQSKRSKDIEHASAERVLVTDINNDQIDDLIMYSPISFWRGNGDFTFTNLSDTWLPNDKKEINLISAITDIDIDNDGDLDLYLARGKTYYELANKSLDFDSEVGRIDLRDQGNKGTTSMEFEAAGDLVLSGLFLWYRQYNDGFPLHMGAQKDTVTLTENSSYKVSQNMANGWPSVRNENGWYLGYLGNDKWKLEWVRNKPVYWGIRLSIDGVKNMSTDWTAQNRNVSDILLRNEGDRFTDVSEKWNIPKGGNHWGVTVGDFNNDSHSDLYIYRFGFLRSRVIDWLLLNDGQGKFEKTTSHNATDPNDQGHGDMGQAFDMDLDGKVDLLSGSDDPGKWYLYGNQSTNNNSFAIVRVGYSPKENIDCYSAVVILETKNNVFRKRVGSAGEIHSQSLLNSVHFGLGTETEITKITVKWRNGEEEILENVAVNQLYDLP